MGFMKLDESVLYSTIWDASWEELKVFLSCGLVARPYTLEHEEPQLDPITDQPTGWIVPPGEYGFAKGAASGLVRAANLGPDRTEVGMLALRRLGEPELGSKTQAYGGRRVVRIDGGFLVLNLMKFRDCTSAERQKRFRARRKKEKGKKLTHSQLRDQMASVVARLPQQDPSPPRDPRFPDVDSSGQD